MSELTAFSPLPFEHNTSTMGRPRKFVVGKLNAGSRRLSSLAVSSNQPAYSLSLAAIAPVDRDRHDLNYTADIVRKYNAILPFVTSRRRRQLDDMKERHQQMTETRNEIQETWQTCLETLNGLECDLSFFAECQEELILEDRTWYRKANVFGGSSSALARRQC